MQQMAAWTGCDPSPTLANAHGLLWEGGVGATELMEALAPHFGRIDHYPLSEEAAFGVKPVSDERYALVAQDGVPHRPMNRTP